MPVIHLEKCTSCLKCERDCPARAITIETGEISKSCILCGHCVAICPELAVSPDFGGIIPLSAHGVTAEGFRDLTAGIRSCRSYLKKEIPEELLVRLVDNIKHYPSASNTRPLQVTIVRTGEKIKLLNNLTEETLLKKFSRFTSFPVSLFVKLLIPSGEFKKLKLYRKKFAEQRKTNDSMICHHAPAVILFHGPETKTGMFEADANIWATYTSVYANTMGLGTCFNGFIVNAMKKKSGHSADFGIPSGHRVYASLLVGYPKVKYVNECSRNSPEINLV